MSKILTRERVEIEKRNGMRLFEQVSVLKRYWICACCHIRNVGTLHYDHIVPLALGGKDHPDNIWPICHHCHTIKTKQDQAAIARAKRLAGETCQGPSRRPLPFGKGSKLKKKIGGRIIRRNGDVGSEWND